MMALGCSSAISSVLRQTRTVVHAKRGKHADTTLAPLSISTASAYGEAEPCRVAAGGDEAW